MSANNLNRDEAAERSRLLTIERTAVHLDLTTSESTFRSRAEITVACAEPGSPSFLNLTAPSVQSVTVDGLALDVEQVFDGNRIALPALGARSTIVIDATCAFSRTGEGLHRFVDPVDGTVYLHSQFETFDAHRMYACFDQPDLKTVFALTVTAPADWQVVSNMHVLQASADGDATTTTFADSPRMSTYITALVAGHYHMVRDRHGEIDLGVYCRRSLAEHLDADEIFAVTKQGFDFFESLFDYPYPFGKYDQLFVPEFNAGAMENAGCVTFLEDYVFRSKVTRASYERRAETILHEMAHMWFGDLVTMRWWDDLWLNESFASYMAVLASAEATQFTGAWTTFANVEKTWALRQDQLPSTHPIAADIPDNEAVSVNFDGITYAKGASVLRQLVAYVGFEKFIEGTRQYFRTHEYSNTSLADLLGPLGESTGRDLSAWSRLWLETAGVNTLRAVVTEGADGTYESVSIAQSAPADHPTLRPHRLALGLYDLVDGRLTRRERIELDVDGPTTAVPELGGVRVADLLLVNDDDLTYAKLRFDARSMATVTENLGAISDPLARTLCWGASWDMTRDAEMPARDYVRAVLSGVPAESDIGVVQTALRQALAAISQYADPVMALALRRAVADANLEWLRAAAPGSDRQLVFARMFTSATVDADHVSVVESILDGASALDGLVVDADLRWHLLRRLAVLGVVGESRIDAELANDPTAAGQRQAAAARASLPTIEAKEAAWAQVVDSDELANATLAAVIGGFVQSEQPQLMADFVGRYFEVIASIWADRNGEIAQSIAVGLYPDVLVDESVISATDAFLAREDVAPALRRLIVEGRAGVTRALAARECDRAAG